MSPKTRKVIYTIGGGLAVAVGLVIAAKVYGSHILEICSWVAAIVTVPASVVGTLVALRDHAPATPPVSATTTAPGLPEPRTAEPRPGGDQVGTPSLSPDGGRLVCHAWFAAEAWSVYLEHTDVSEGLLRGKPARELSGFLAPLDKFLKESLPNPNYPEPQRAAIKIEIGSAYRKRNVPVDTVAQFWTVMLVDSILRDGGVGLQRWLLRETDKILRDKKQDELRLRQVWQWMFDTYLKSTADQPAPGLMQTLITEAITQCGDDHNRLYRNVNFLIEIARDDPPTCQRIHDLLKEHDGVLRERGSSPAMLKRVQLLLGRLGAAGGPAPFNPDLVTFPVGAPFPYEFKAMLYPLTVGDVEGILRRPDGTNPAMPYVLPQDRADGSAFAGMWRVLRDILGSLPGPADRDDWRWDIPTVAEWITLAGCASQPYPWGDEPPTRLRANLKFEPDSGLSPVGTYIAGLSPAGVYDCCGGVHEIVYELPHERFDTDRHFENAFRLAGGSYRTPAHGFTGQRFRHLSPRDRGNRPSCVGVRLIAYRKEDETKRWEALRGYRLSRQRPAVARTP